MDDDRLAMALGRLEALIDRVEALEARLAPLIARYTDNPAARWAAKRGRNSGHTKANAGV